MHNSPISKFRFRVKTGISYSSRGRGVDDFVAELERGRDRFPRPVVIVLPDVDLSAALVKRGRVRSTGNRFGIMASKP